MSLWSYLAFSAAAAVMATPAALLREVWPMFSCCCSNFADEDTLQITYKKSDDPDMMEENCGPFGVPQSVEGRYGATYQSSGIYLNSYGNAPGYGSYGGYGGYGSHSGYGSSARSPRASSRDTLGAPVGSFSARSSGGQSASSQGSSARSQSPSERQREKDRLQDLTREFAKAAVNGQPCLLLPAEGTGCIGNEAPRTAKYSLDKALRTFTLQADGAAPSSIGLMSIRDLIKDVRDTPFVGGARLRAPASVGSGDPDRCFVCLQVEVEARGGSGTALRHVGLLLPDPYERERFFTCMKLLRWALETRLARHSERGGV